ncbi:alpha/beta hydrolase [Actinoplanes sp. TRM 88003]|uniref:Alpha/beta hydrolase n=1 Tax=Paractinoplanes aksuensis TaxID=2939490 RepID=A0ABT1DS86_9ACTN|nr:alpha/beta hydrolase [Actinoplanes aksuensis]MCO8273689.1 alpha/beta hydrolase [Actinoplanes aksuensis]
MPDPIVLVHHDSVAWTEQHGALTAAGHRVVPFTGSGPGELAGFLRRPDLDGCVLVGAAAGTGTVVRCLSTYGSGGVRKAVLIGAVPPCLRRSADNPDGLDDDALAYTRARLAGRPEVVEAVLHADYRADLARIDVPVLLLHGDADLVLPIDATAHRLPGLIPDLRYEVVPDGPHDLGRTRPEAVNRYLLDWVAS